MCGRYTLIKTEGVPHLVPDADLTPAAKAYLAHPHYNVAPGSDNPIIWRRSEANLEVSLARWGFIPSWSRPEAQRYRMINARSETVFTKPAYRHAIRHFRCLIPADGFYEWHQEAGKKTKQPYHIHALEGELMTFAGVAALREDAAEGITLSYAILTCPAGADLAPIHDRMPVVVIPALRLRWLTAETFTRPDLEAVIAATRSVDFALRPVGTYVNAPHHDDPRCLAPPTQ